MIHAATALKNSPTPELNKWMLKSSCSGMVKKLLLAIDMYTTRWYEA
jgi:hypothetical protein